MSDIKSQEGNGSPSQPLEKSLIVISDTSPWKSGRFDDSPWKSDVGWGNNNVV